MLYRYHDYMFNMHKVSLDTIKYWLVELYATFFTSSYRPEK